MKICKTIQRQEVWFAQERTLTIDPVRWKSEHTADVKGLGRDERNFSQTETDTTEEEMRLPLDRAVKHDRLHRRPGKGDKR